MPHFNTTNQKLCLGLYFNTVKRQESPRITLIHAYFSDKNIMRLIFLIAFSLLILTGLTAQHNEGHDEDIESTHDEEHEQHKKYKIAASLGMTHIPEAFEHGHEEKAVFVPTIGIDFFYFINHKWSVSFVADLELSNYLINFNREDLERHKALILALQAGYKITSHLGVFVGGGLEIESHKNLAVVRLGTEYDFHLQNNWSIAPSLFFDLKEEYSTYTVGVAIGKKF